MLGFLKRAVQSVLRRSAGDPPQTEYLRWLLGGPSTPNATGQINPHKALTLTTYYAALNFLSTDVGSLPVAVFRKRGRGRERAENHPVHHLLSLSPDGDTTPERQTTAWIGHALGWGNGYRYIHRDAAGIPIRLELLDPQAVEPYRRKSEPDKPLFYRVDGKTHPKENILHLAGFGWDGLRGYTPAYLHRRSLALSIAAQEVGVSFYEKGAQISGLLTTPNMLGPEQAELLRQSWEETHSGPARAGKVAILHSGATFQQVGINPVDAAYLKTLEISIYEIGRMFRMPPHKLMDFSNAHLANIEASNIEYLIATILPWVVRAEQEIRLKLLFADEREEYQIKFNFNAFLRGNMQARAEFYNKLFMVGGMSPNDIRELEDMNPLDENGDLSFVPGNMVALANAHLLTPKTTKEPTRANANAPA